ncbi:MAG TPA: hypothetical protein VHC97_17665 [Thermoanaerobaculia bacterium]|jgi:hypothetical protein|nr:hypothetical protein [Thermoanaerobaculia bacterium]
MPIRRLLFSLLSFVVAVPVLADDVYLINGRKFEGVIAETTGSQVRIQMQGGSLSLPRSQVLRVETGDSSLAEYLRRKEALKKTPGARATDWLELARWAQGRQLEQATRESALAAATLDPKLDGLGPILRGYGYVLDDQIDRWIPYAESMRRRGFVQANGQWLTREEYAARVRAYEEENARRRAQREEQARAAREERLAALAELSVVRDLVRPAYPQVPAYPSPYYGLPVVVIPGYWGGNGAGSHRGRPNPINFTHVPGSLIPGNDFYPPLNGSN